MGVGRRVFGCYLCDSCGREVIAEETQTVDGYYIEVQEVLKGETTQSENIFACSPICIEKAIRDALIREALPEDEKNKAVQELWLRGKQFSTSPEFPVLDMSNPTHQIGTAREIARHRPAPTKRIEA